MCPYQTATCDELGGTANGESCCCIAVRRRSDRRAVCPPLPSVQVLFDNAAGAAAKSDWSGALNGYQALEARLGTNSRPRSLALVRVRKGEALYRLSRFDEAETELRAGLPGLPRGDDSLREDILLALLNLGAIAELSLRFPEAQTRYTEAERLARRRVAPASAGGPGPHAHVR